MEEEKKCPKCGNEMLKGTEAGYFAVLEVATPPKGVITSTNDYMCKKCGFIEIYASNPDLLNGH